MNELQGLVDQLFLAYEGRIAIQREFMAACPDGSQARTDPAFREFRERLLRQNESILCAACSIWRYERERREALAAAGDPP